jgi:hypothetical protein
LNPADLILFNAVVFITGGRAVSSEDVELDKDKPAAGMLF